MIQLTDTTFDPGALLNAFAKGRSETGAIATFTGIARAEKGSTTVLELEAYPVSPRLRSARSPTKPAIASACTM